MDPVVSCASAGVRTSRHTSSVRMSAAPLAIGTDIAFLCHPLSHRVVGLLVGRGQRGKTINVAVEHAERRGDEDGIVDLAIGCALTACPLDVVARDVLA